MQWLELLTHYNYKIHYQPGDKNCAANALSQHAELRPPDGEDDQLTVLIPPENFTKLAACEADMTQADWEGLAEVFMAALTVSDVVKGSGKVIEITQERGKEVKSSKGEW